MHIKLCGLTSTGDLDAALAQGIDAVGLNLVASSPRFVGNEGTARTLAEHGLTRATLVWVIDAQPPAWLTGLLERYPASIVQRTDPTWPWPNTLAVERRWDVVRLNSHDDVRRAEALDEGILLCDSAGTLGGSGRLASWPLCAELAARRPVILAGGLTADNVAQAIAQVKPWGVDVASGIESTPGKKDLQRMRAFVANARGSNA